MTTQYNLPSFKDIYKYITGCDRGVLNGQVYMIKESHPAARVMGLLMGDFLTLEKDKEILDAITEAWEAATIVDNYPIVNNRLAIGERLLITYQKGEHTENGSVWKVSNIKRILSDLPIAPIERAIIRFNAVQNLLDIDVSADTPEKLYADLLPHRNKAANGLGSPAFTNILEDVVIIARWLLTDISYESGCINTRAFFIHPRTQRVFNQLDDHSLMRNIHPIAKMFKDKVRSVQ
jgi:hypothetical protein